MGIRDVAACIMTATLGALACAYSASGLAAVPGHAGYTFSLLATLVHLNERGQVLTQVVMDTGLTHVVVAKPD